MSNRSIIPALLLLLTLALVRPGLASSSRIVSAQDIVSAVNGLRSSHGLKPYEVDSGLMAYAQRHSEYQAAIDSITHLHSDGSTASSQGLLENIAAGNPDSLNAETVVYQIWTDGLHREPMLGYSSGAMGAGADMSNSTIYITLVVRPGGAAVDPPAAESPGSSSPSPQQGPGNQQATASPTAGSPLAATSVPPTPLPTSTPQADGSIVHIVRPGESLWSIAISYGVRIDDLLTLNRLPPGSNTIYEGQKLLILPAGQATPGAGVTETAAPGQEEPQANSMQPEQAELEAQAAGQPAEVVPSPSSPAAALESTEAPSPTPAASPEAVRDAALSAISSGQDTSPKEAGGETFNLMELLLLLFILLCSSAAALILRAGFRKRSEY